MISRMPRYLRFLVVLIVAAVLSARVYGQAPNEPTAAAPAAMDPAEAALAGFDESTGLWFPPDAPREVYLNRSDPKHDLILDARKAFEANPALRKAVCELTLDPKREVRTSTLPQSVLQRRTMFHMLCLGLQVNEEEEARNEKAWQAHEADFEKWRDAAAARQLDGEERRARMLRIDAELMKPSDDFVRASRAFEMLGLNPQADHVVYRLLAVSPFRGSKSDTRFQDYLRRLFERESSAGMPEAGRYRMALRSFFFYTNQLPEARALSQRVLEEEALARWKTDNRAVLGLLDRLLGDTAGLKRAASTCGAPTQREQDYKDRPAGAFCFDLFYSSASRSIELHGDKAPKGLVEVLVEIIAAEPTNWPRRSSAVHDVAVLDAGRGRALADELLQLPATLVPLGARLDALSVIGRTSRKLGDFRRALGAYDYYLALLRYRPVPVPADLWSRLTAVPEEEKGPRAESERLGWLNITWALGRKVGTLIDAGDFPAARLALEELLAATFALAEATEKERKKERIAELVDDEDMDATEREALKALLGQNAEASGRAARDQLRFIRNDLSDLAAALLKAGRQDEAKRVVAYLLAQPGGERYLPMSLYPFYNEAKARGEPIQPATSPWDAAVRAGRAARVTRSKR